jgi:hypothetical protein
MNPRNGLSLRKVRYQLIPIVPGWPDGSVVLQLSWCSWIPGSEARIRVGDGTDDPDTGCPADAPEDTRQGTSPSTAPLLLIHFHRNTPVSTAHRSGSRDNDPTATSILPHRLSNMAGVFPAATLKTTPSTRRLTNQPQTSRASRVREITGPITIDSILTKLRAIRGVLLQDL